MVYEGSLKEHAAAPRVAAPDSEHFAVQVRDFAPGTA
jgi:hypothetical protein